MTSNGQHNGNGRTTGQKIRSELAGFGLAELAAEGTWLGAAAVTTLVPEKVMKAASRTIGREFVLPFLDPLEVLIRKVCKLEECQIDSSKPRMERAENLGRAIIVFTPAFAASWAMKLWIRHKYNDSHGLHGKHEERILNPSTNMIFITDELTQLGSMFVLNNQLATASDKMIRGLTGVTQKVMGVPENRAHEFASTVVVWAVPNAVGAVGAAAAIAAKHALGWPKGWWERLLGGGKAHP